MTLWLEREMNEQRVANNNEVHNGKRPFDENSLIPISVFGHIEAACIVFHILLLPRYISYAGCLHSFVLHGSRFLATELERHVSVHTHGSSFVSKEHRIWSEIRPR